MDEIAKEYDVIVLGTGTSLRHGSEPRVEQLAGRQGSFS
jgi:hypothetical protein